MNLRESDKRVVNNIRFSGIDIAIASKMLDSMATTMDILYYLMNRGDENAFVIMLLSAKCEKAKEFLSGEKRDTDILFEIDKEEGIYSIICQDTKVDGGYRFAERIMRHLSSKDIEDIYLTELEIKTTKYDIKYIIFKLIEMHIKAKIDKKNGEIVFRSLH